MPTAFLKKMAKEKGYNLKTLEEFWDKAMDVAKKEKDPEVEDYYAYVMGIFKNMIKGDESKKINPEDMAFKVESKLKAEARLLSYLEKSSVSKHEKKGYKNPNQEERLEALLKEVDKKIKSQGPHADKELMKKKKELEKLLGM